MDALKDVFGSSKLKTGLNGFSFSNINNRGNTPQHYSPRPIDNTRSEYQASSSSARTEAYYASNPCRSPNPGYPTRKQYDGNDVTQFEPPPKYDSLPGGDPADYQQSAHQSNWYSNDDSSSGSRHGLYNTADPMSAQSSFRPFVLPQIDFGDGSPFLRAYSNELQQYGVDERQFIQIVDSLNRAIIPNPEAQLFEKTAKTAGYFLPGVDGIALAGGRLAVGVGAAFGLTSHVNKRLSEANLGVFLPRGLEICMGRPKHIDEATGIQGIQQGSVDPVDRIAAYGNRVARLSAVYPAIDNSGRSDPIAMWGKSMSKRDNARNAKSAARKVERASRRGREVKKDKREDSMKWLIVRKASPESTAQWQKTLQQSQAAIDEEQRRGASQSGPSRY